MKRKVKFTRIKILYQSHNSKRTLIIYNFDFENFTFLKNDLNFNLNLPLSAFDDLCIDESSNFVHF